jgi:hypothetical protein
LVNRSVKRITSVKLEICMLETTSIVTVDGKGLVGQRSENL